MKHRTQSLFFLLTSIITVLFAISLATSEAATPGFIEVQDGQIVPAQIQSDHYLATTIDQTFFVDDEPYDWHYCPITDERYNHFENTDNIYWGDDPPNTAGKAWTIVWKGQFILFNSEVVTFTISFDQWVELYIDGVLVYQRSLNLFGHRVVDIPIQLVEGIHDIQLIYYDDYEGSGDVSLSWSSPSIPFSFIGPAVLEGQGLVVSGSKDILLFYPLSKSPAVKLSAQSPEPGGTYQWEILYDGKDRAVLLRKNGKQTKIRGIAPSIDLNDVTVKVTRYDGGQATASALHELTVRKPSAVTSLGCVPKTDFPTRFFYLLVCTMQVSDKFGPIGDKRIKWDEDRVWAQCGYKSNPIGRPKNRHTDEAGKFDDQLWLEGSKEVPENSFTKIRQQFYIGGWNTYEFGTFCQTYYLDHAESKAGECSCP